MKKKLSLFVLFAMLLSFAIQAKNTIVTSKDEFTSAWGAQTGGDTISFAPTGDTPLNLGRVTLSENGGKYVIMSEYSDPDSMAVIQVEIDGANLEETKFYSLFFENIHLQYRSPSSGSGQIIYFNKIYANVDSVVFRNCEMSNSVRSIFRSKPDTTSTAGDLNYFEVTNCKIHHTTLTENNGWPLFYFGHMPYEVVIKNNSFYDLPYLKNIFNMNYADPDNPVTSEITFENNTVIATLMDGGALINTSNYLDAETRFYFNNNLILVPNWSDEDTRSVNDTTFNEGKLITCRQGMIEAKNNVIENYQPWSAGRFVDDEEGTVEFLMADTLPQYTLDSLGMSWSDFTDPENNDYSYLSTLPLASAGVDGAAIGDSVWLKVINDPKNLTVTSNVDSAVVVPAKGVYENGDSVTVEAYDMMGYEFLNWTNEDSTVVYSTDQVYKFKITEDITLKANYVALRTRTISVDMKNTSSATYSITPVQEEYFVGDEVTVTVDPHAVNDFLGWEDGSTSLTNTFTVNDDTTLIANFKEHNYIMAWDFSNLSDNNMKFDTLASNVYYKTDNKGIFYMIGDGGAEMQFDTRNNKFSSTELHYCALRKDPVGDDQYYFVAEISTKGYANVNVKSLIGTDNCMYSIQKMEYSLDGQTWMGFAADTIPHTSEADFNQVWFDFDGTLPSEAIGQEKVYVRWIADATSEIAAISTSDKSKEYLYLSNIEITGDKDTGGATWRVESSLTHSYYPGQQIVCKDGKITLTLGGADNAWSVADSVFTFDNVTYVSNLRGTGNPKNNGSNYSVDSNNPPTTGAFYKFDVTEDGFLDVGVKINGGKTSYVLEGTSPISEEYNGFVRDETSYESITIDVNAGGTYYFFSSGSKMGLLGFRYRTDVLVKDTKAKSLDVYAKDGIIYINNAKGNIQVYNVIGNLVKAVSAKDGIMAVPGLSSGIYIVKIGSLGIKIML